MVFVDSSVWIDYFNGRSTSKTRLDEPRPAVSPLTL